MTTTNKAILRLALPSILANITIPLVGIVDTAIVGHLSDAAAIGGIAIGTMLFDLLYWNFGFLRVGTSGLTAQAYGAGDKEEYLNVLVRGIVIALTVAVLLLLLQYPIALLCKRFIRSSPATIELMLTYFYIRIWAAPATLSLFTFKGWFIGMQDTKSPMAVDILVNVVNMAASYYLAVKTPLGVVGVAYGTLVAQYSGLILAVAILLARYIGISVFRNIDRWKEALRGAELRRMLSLNTNLFIRSLCFMVVYVGYTSLASLYGDTELAVSSIMMKLFMFFSFFVDGFAYAGEALVGKAFGESSLEHCKTPEIHRTVRALFNWALGVGLLFTVIYAFWGDEAFALMTSDATVLAAAVKYKIWLIGMPLISTLAFMWDGVYIGATAGVQIRNSMIWAAVGFIIGYVATFSFVGPQALYIGYFAHLIARAFYLTIQWNKVVG